MRQYLFILPAFFLASCGANLPASTPVDPSAQSNSLTSQDVTFQLNPTSTCDINIKIAAKDNTEWELSASGASYQKTLNLDASSTWTVQAHCQNQSYGNAVSIQVNGHPHYTIGTQNSGTSLGGGLYLSQQPNNS